MNLPKIPENFFKVSENKNILTEEDKIDKTINSALDSVWVINHELSKEYFDNDSYQLIKSNYEHIKIILNNNDIKNSNRDLTSLVSAFELAKQALILLDNRTIEHNVEEVDNFIESILNEQSK